MRHRGLAGGGSERVVFTSPENPTAILRIANPLVPAAERSRRPAFAITEFATDSPLEGRVRCELVSEFLESIKRGPSENPKFPASWENTGKFIDFGL